MLNLLVRKKAPIRYAALSIFATTVIGSASAQSLEAFQGVYAGNDGAWTGVAGNGSQNSAANPFLYSTSFSGNDSLGNPQVETLSATAYSSSTYGVATASGAGTVTNPYYNSGNLPYFDGTNYNPTTGSPDLLSVHGNAGWADTLTFSGVSSSDLVIFDFSLTGTGSGPIAAGINFFTDSGSGTYYGQATTSTSASWITQGYSVNAGGELGITVDYYAGMTSFLSQQPEGVTYTGSYSSQLALTGIEVTDANGNLVNGWSVSAASGANYPQAVPEPASVLALGLGACGLIRRRRNRR